MRKEACTVPGRETPCQKKVARDSRQKKQQQKAKSSRRLKAKKNRARGNWYLLEVPSSLKPQEREEEPTALQGESLKLSVSFAMICYQLEHLPFFS